jgi:hypothetical protein
MTSTERRPGLRLRWVLWHLLFSGLVAAAAWALIRGLWYPDGYGDLMGGPLLLLLLVGVNLVLGPLLTGLVADPTKSRRALALDLSVIAALQLAALGYGLWVTAQARPVHTVLAVDRLDVVSAFEVEAGDVSWTGPKEFRLRLPDDGPGRTRALDVELAGGNLAAMPEYLVPSDPAAVLAQARPLDVLRTRHPQIGPQLDAALARLGADEAALRWLPVRTRFGFQTALVDAASGRLRGFVAQDPY